MRKRVEWTEHHEQPTLVAAISDLMAKDSRLKLLKAVNLAQVALPEIRRRKILQIKNLPQPMRAQLIDKGLLSKDWEARKRRPKEEDPVLLERDSLRSENRALRESVASLEAELRTFRSAPPPLTELEHVKKFLSDVLSEVASRGRAVIGVEGSRGTSMADVAEAIKKHDPGGRPEEKIKPPKVLICGLKPHQRPPFETKYHGRLRISFWYLEKGGSAKAEFDRLREKASSAEIVFAAAQAIDHETMYQLKQVANGRAHLVQGGSSELMDRLDKFITS